MSIALPELNAIRSLAHTLTHAYTRFASFSLCNVCAACVVVSSLNIMPNRIRFVCTEQTGRGDSKVSFEVFALCVARAISRSETQVAGIK